MLTNDDCCKWNIDNINKYNNAIIDHEIIFDRPKILLDWM